MSAPIFFASHSRTCAAMAIVASAALSAGCAPPRQTATQDPRPSTSLIAAQYQAEGAGYRPVLRAPSQLRIALKPAPAPQPLQQDEAPQHIDHPGAGTPQTPTHAAVAATATPLAAQAAAQLIPQAQTYMGTLPCFAPGMHCAAQRVTLTLAPNRRWRARISVVAGDHLHKPSLAEQGCWAVTGERPPRILLLDKQGHTRAEFLLATPNTLRVQSVAGNTPNLAYSLTRQPDLDPIDELAKQPTPACP